MTAEKKERNEAIVDLRRYDRDKYSIVRLKRVFEFQTKITVYNILKRYGVLDEEKKAEKQG